MTHINNLSHAESLQHLEKYQKRCINTFLKKQAFFEHLDAANRSTTKCPAKAAGKSQPFASNTFCIFIEYWSFSS